jgi:hypothetical protein
LFHTAKLEHKVELAKAGIPIRDNKCFKPKNFVKSGYLIIFSGVLGSNGFAQDYKVLSDKSIIRWKGKTEW